MTAKHPSECVSDSNALRTSCTHERGASERDCKPMSIAEIITKHLPALAKIIVNYGRVE